MNFFSDHDWTEKSFFFAGTEKEKVKRDKKNWLSRKSLKGLKVRRARNLINFLPPSTCKERFLFAFADQEISSRDGEAREEKKREKLCNFVP